jgi:exodeoxyribonuclease V alpha subunit
MSENIKSSMGKTVKQKGVVETIIYKKDNFAILKLKNGTVILGQHTLGNIDKVKGENVSVTGHWVENKKTKDLQIQIQTIEIVGSDTIFYFLTKVVTGLGPKKTLYLLDHFGADKIADMIANRPHELLHVKGFNKALVATICASWHRHIAMREISELLLPLGFSPIQVNNVYMHYLEDIEGIARRINENIYLLTDVRGIGFIGLDEVALESGMVEPNSIFRISSAVIYGLKQIGQEHGHSIVSKIDLYKILDDLLIRFAKGTTSRDCFDYQAALKKLINTKKIVCLNADMYCLKSLYDAEMFLYEFFNSRSNEMIFPVLNEKKMNNFIAGLEKKAGHKYDSHQVRAIRAINERKIMALVGYAGTGKTFTTRGILELLSTYYTRDSVYVTALSGIAADKIKNASGFDGGTIMSILVKYKQEATIPFKVLVIDECSMLDSVLFARLLRKLHPDARLVLVGDPSQLPALAAGAVFIDVIKNKLVPVLELKTIHRQSENSVIALHAEKIRNGQVPEYHTRHADFAFAPFNINNPSRDKDVRANQRNDNNMRICLHVAKAFENKKGMLNDAFEKGDFQKFLYSTQVIVPMKKGILGVDNLNQTIQNTLNPGGVALSVNSMGNTVLFKKMDKVLHTKNFNMPVMSIDEFNKEPNREVPDDSKKRIFNGYLGAVIKVDIDEFKLWAYYPAEEVVVRYDKSDIESMLTLGHVITCHKSQGSGFLSILLPLSMSFFKMLSSCLMYTSLTRGRQMAYIVGEEAAFKRACTQHEVLERKTILGVISQ